MYRGKFQRCLVKLKMAGVVAAVAQETGKIIDAVHKVSSYSAQENNANGTVRRSLHWSIWSGLLGMSLSVQ